MILGILIGLVAGIVLCCAMFALIVISASRSKKTTMKLQDKWHRETLSALDRNHEDFENIASAIWHGVNRNP